VVCANDRDSEHSLS